jgi:hypothetical protein
MSVVKLDARESAFFARETEYIKSKTYDAKPPALKGLSLVPFTGEMGTGVSEITWRRFTEAGEAKIIADYSKDYPRVDVWGDEETIKVKDLGDSYGYSIREIRQSMQTGKRLDQKRATAARHAIDRKINKMVLLSNPDERTFGALDFPGLTESTLPADGQGNSKRWTDKTVDQILRDLDILIDAVFTPTKGNENPDTLLLPITAWRKLKKRLGTDSDSTLGKFIADNYPEIKKIDWMNELAGLGAGGTDRVMVGIFDEDHIEAQIPSQFEQLDTEQHGGEFTIPCQASCAGVIVYYPMAFAYADGI